MVPNIGRYRTGEVHSSRITPSTVHMDAEKEM